MEWGSSDIIHYKNCIISPIVGRVYPITHYTNPIDHHVLCWKNIITLLPYFKSTRILTKALNNPDGTMSTDDILDSIMYPTLVPTRLVNNSPLVDRLGNSSIEYIAEFH